MKQKRRWAWKEKHVRKHRTISQRIHRGGPPKDFIGHLHSGDKQKRLVDCKKIILGYEDVDTSPKYHPSEARWLWF